MPIKLNTASGGGVILQGANTASDTTLTVPAVTATVLTDSAGVLNIGSGQVYKDASGSVGIGTSSPSTKLDINNGSLNLSVGYNLQWGGNGNQAIAYTSSSLVFYNGAERARIDSSGNLLVGATSQLGFGKLCVSLNPTVSDGLVTRPTANATYSAATFQNSSGTNVGNISCTATATSYGTSSDYRLKENVQPMTGALAKVAALKPVTYTWKADGSAGEGFIAHELAEVVPDCVTGEKDAVDADGNPVYQGIDTSFLVATLTAAIQELKAEVDSLRAQVEAK